MTGSSAIGRKEEVELSAAFTGLDVSPYPRRSPHTTVKRSASSGATLAHMKRFCGYPWSSSRAGPVPPIAYATSIRSEEHTSELQSLMRISYAVFCLKKKNIEI